MTKTPLKTIMWRILQTRKTVTYDDMQELTGASRTYIQEWMTTLIKRGVVEKLKHGHFRMIDELAEMDGAQETDPVIHPLSYGSRPSKPARVRPEYQLWQAIKRMKTFTQGEMKELKLANLCFTSLYISMLCKAGILEERTLKDKKLPQYGGRYPKQYKLTKKAGKGTPIIGRMTYLYDPNQNEYFLTQMERFENKKGLEEAATS